MAANRIEQLIDDIYDFLDGCKAVPFTQNKIQVNKDELFDMLEELRERTPDEIKRYQKIIANRDAIIADAEDKADKIIAEAEAKAKQMVSEHEIMQQAYQRVNDMVTAAGQDADEMVQKAKFEAEQLTTGALNYANNIMYDMEKILSDAYESTKQRSEMLIQTLKESYETVAENRLQIYNQLDPDYIKNEYGDAGYEADVPAVDEEYGDYEDGYDDYDDEYAEDGDYSFDENTFLDNID